MFLRSYSRLGITVGIHRFGKPNHRFLDSAHLYFSGCRRCKWVSRMKPLLWSAIPRRIRTFPSRFVDGGVRHKCFGGRTWASILSRREQLPGDRRVAFTCTEVGSEMYWVKPRNTGVIIIQVVVHSLTAGPEGRLAHTTHC